MESAPGSLALAVPATSALTVFGNVNSDLQSYQQSITVVGNDQSAVASRNLELAATGSKVELAQEHFAAASQALKGFAVSEYVSTGLFSGAPLEGSPGSQEVTPNTPQSADGVVAEQYIHLTASTLVAKSTDAAAALGAAQQLRAEAASALAQAALVLASDEAAENHTLSQLISDLATMEHAGACANVTVTPPAPAAGGSSGSTATTTTTVPDSTTTTVSVPPTTTTTTSTTVPSTTTTTTTTVPSTTTTTDLAEYTDHDDLEHHGPANHDDDHDGPVDDHDDDGALCGLGPLAGCDGARTGRRDLRTTRLPRHLRSVLQRLTEPEAVRPHSCDRDEFRHTEG